MPKYVFGKKWSTEISGPDKKIPDWNIIRTYIDNIGKDEVKNTLKILYLFGITCAELAREDTSGVSLMGSDLIETVIILNNSSYFLNLGRDISDIYKQTFSDILTFTLLV